MSLNNGKSGKKKKKTFEESQNYISKMHTAL